MKIVYVASPYSGPTRAHVEANVRRSVELAAHVIAAGFVPAIPQPMYHALATYEMIELGLARPYEEWMDACLTLLSHCDALVFVTTSNGVDAEIDYATKNDIPVFFGIPALIKGLQV